MFRRSLVVLLVCIAILPACKKKKPTDNGGGTEPGPVPASVSSEYVVFAHLRAKDIRDNPLFAEVKAAVAKAGGTAEWEKLEQEASSVIGLKPTDIDSVTAFVTEVPQGNMPKIVGMMTTSKPIDKSKLAFLGPQARPDQRGFYTLQGSPVGGFIHFPDDKTIAFVSTDLAQKYLDGYAKNRTGWPMNAELSKAAAGHTLYAMIQLDKVPSQMTQTFTRGPEFKDFAPALSARKIIVTADLKGKELSVGARVGFPDAAAAGKARDSVQKAIGMALGEVDKVLAGKGPPELSGFMPAVQEAQRALKDAKVDVRGSDLTVSGSYKANFDVGAMVAEAVKKMQGSADSMRETNNLKQIGLALINYSDTNGGLAPIYAAGATGLPLKAANETPLLSWRVAILPYIEQVDLYRKFKLNEPWDSPNNKKLIELMPKIYAPPTTGKPGYTHLQMVIGPNALQPVGTKYPASFPDGTSNTIAVVEAAEPVIWTKPDDIMMPGNLWPKDFRKKFGGLKPGGFYAALWDGSVHFVRNSVSDQTLGFALNPRDGQTLGKDW